MKKQQIIKSGEGKNYSYSQDHCFVKVASNQTNQELCFVEDILKPGFYLPRHHHKIMLEVFYILEGEVEYGFDDETVTAKAGDTIIVPQNVWHSAKCEKGGKMLSIFKNGQFDEYLAFLSTLSEKQFADSEYMAEVSARFDIYE
jgi:quercetin dioxygenase-like cupin family protein